MSLRRLQRHLASEGLLPETLAAALEQLGLKVIPVGDPIETPYVSDYNPPHVSKMWDCLRCGKARCRHNESFCFECKE